MDAQDAKDWRGTGAGKMNKKSMAQWRQRMKQFHRETQEGLGGFEAAIIRAEDLPSIVQSEDRDRRSRNGRR